MFPDRTQLKLARYASSTTNQEVSEATGLSPAVISAIETGKSDPRQSTITKLQTFYEAKGVEFALDGWVRLSLKAEAERQGA